MWLGRRNASQEVSIQAELEGFSSILTPFNILPWFHMCLLCEGLLLYFNAVMWITITFWGCPLCGLTISSGWARDRRCLTLERLIAAAAAAAAAAAKSLQLCPTLCDPIDGSPPGSPIPGILQARTLEWVAISFSNAWKWKVKVKSLINEVTPFPSPEYLDLSGKLYGHCISHHNFVKYVLAS